MAQGKEGTSNIIHAGGVRVDFPSSAPKARNALSFWEVIIPTSRPEIGRAALAAFGARQEHAVALR